MKILSAGWRIEYIGKPDDGTCIFCEKPKKKDDEVLIVKRARLAYVIMNLYPYTTGHLMVAPYRHAGKMADLSDEESCEMMRLICWCERVLKDALRPEGFNIGMNIGRCAGAGYPGHVHMHIVPRWEGDTNFMPIVGEVKVLPETLMETYRKIMAASLDVEGKQE